MKNAILTLTLALSLFGAATGEARSIKRFSTITLSNLNVDKKLASHSTMRPTHGTIRLDYLERTATLRLIHDSCPAGAKCLIGPMTIYEAVLPLASTEAYGCGSYVISASEDKRPVDGALRKLTMLDNTVRSCIPAGKIEVFYETALYDRRNGGEVKTLSSFTGEYTE